MAILQSIEFIPFGPPIKVKGGQHLPKHMGEKWGAIGNSLGEHVRNLGTLCFDPPSPSPLLYLFTCLEFWDTTPPNCSSQETEVFFKCKKGQEGEKIPSKHCVPEPPPQSPRTFDSNQSWTGHTNCDHRNCSKTSPQEKSRKKQKTPKQNKTKQRNKLKDKNRSENQVQSLKNLLHYVQKSIL